MEIEKKCAPSKQYKDGSCFSLDALQKIALEYNKQNTDTIEITNNKEHLIKILNNKFSNSCSDQVCWLRTKLVKQLDDDDILNNTFRPSGPSKKYEWLSTTHINDVVEQYHKLYPHFLFLGAVPYDFEELDGLGLKTINYVKLEKEGKYKLGMVINLDEHDENGSHWVALYVDLRANLIYFFDSVGKPPGKKIKKFINKITQYLYEKKFNKKLKISKLLNEIKNKNKKLLLDVNFIDIKYNQIQHQFKNSECGVYSMNFIIRLLKGETFTEITENITKDDEMNKCRETYFVN
jgi:hypothetical protein